MAFLHRFKRDLDTQAALALWACYALLMTLIAYRSHFAILANDAFPLLFQAESLSWGDPRSFYNGFFPIGYPALLRSLLLFGRQHIDATGVMINIVLMFGLIWSLIKLNGSQGWNKWWAVLGVTIAIFLPEMLRGVLSLRPDLIVTVLATIAFLAYQKRRFGYAGIVLGVACLFRTHALALIIAFAIVICVFHSWKDAIRLVGYALPFLVLQAIVNLAAGESPLSSSQGFNIAKMVYGTDWRQDQLTPPDALDIALHEPVRLLQAYLTHLMTEWYFLLVLVIAVCIRQTREFAIIGLLYFLAVGFGGSPRGSLPIQPIVAWSAFTMLGVAMRPRIERMGSLAPIALAALVFVGSGFLLSRSADKAGNRIKRYQDVGNRLGVRSTDDAKRILTDDFAMYFPQIRNASPYANGGWGPIGIPLYHERMPQFMQSDPQKLHDAMSARGVNFVVMSQPSTDPRLQETVTKDTALFFRLPDISGYAVYITR